MFKLDARLKIMLAMLIWGTIGLFVRNIDVASSELALYRAVCATGMIGAYLVLTGDSIPFGKIKKELPLLLASGVALGFNWIFLFQAYKYTTISLATLSYYFAPVIVTLVCPILFKEKLGKKQCLCFVMSTIGLVLITGIGDLSGGNSSLLGIMFGLAAASLYAMVVLLNKFIKNVEGIHRTLLQFVAAVIVLLPYVLVTNGIHLGNLSATGWIYLLIVGLVHTGLTYCLYFPSLKEVSGQKASVLSYIDPFVAVLLSVVVLGETMTVTQALGGLLILGFTLYNEL